MASAHYSFIDIAVLDEVRTRFAAGDALALLTTDLDRILWANGPGAAFLGYGEIEAAIGAPSRLGPTARRQIAAAPGFPSVGRDRPVTVRLGDSLINLVVSSLTLPDGERALLLASPAPRRGTEADVCERAISGFNEAGHFAALVDAEGNIAAASRAFGHLGIARQTLLELVEEVRGEPDRLVKRLVPGAPRRFPAGIARLTDDPALHLLVVVDEEETPGTIGALPPAAEESAAPGRGGGEPGRHPARPPVPETSSAASRFVPGTGPADDHDNWYFTGGEVDAARAERRPDRPFLQEQPDTSTAAARHSLETRPVRFAWRTDAEMRFTAISPEFASAVGRPAADIVGRSFIEVSEKFNLDPRGEIAGLLARRDTWSGRTVLWPVAGTNFRIPVDLAALPVYGRERRFEGFRGFGIARGGDAEADPEAIGMRLVRPAATEDAGRPEQDGDTESTHPPQQEEPTPEAEAPADPFKGEVPAITFGSGTRGGEKVIRLSEHRPVAREIGLSQTEQNAFREIAERLRRDSATDTEVPEAAEAGPAAEADQAPSAEERRYPEEEELGSAPHDEKPKEAPSPETVEAAPASAEEAREPAADVPATSPEADGSPREAANRAGGDNLAFLPSAFSGSARARSGGVDPAVLANLPVPVLVHAGDVLHFANRDFLALTGYESLAALEEGGGLGAIFADPYDDDGSGAEPSGRTLRLRTAEGEEFPVEAHLQSIAWNGGKALLLALRRVREPETSAPRDTAASADERIEELEMRLAEMRTIVDTATDGVVIIDNDGKIRSISRPAEALFGYDSAEVTGKPFISLFAIESQRAAEDYLESLAGNGVASVLNDGREVIGRESQGRFIPLFMTIGRLPRESGFCAVVRDVTQWKRAEEELTQARARAEYSSSQKTEFLARVSHEIRTPLNAIIGFSELMLDEKFGPIGNDRYRDYLRDINRSGNHVLDLVNDLLDISKIEAGEQEMHYEAVSLNETLAEIVAMMQPQANRDRVIIRSSFASRLPDVVADLRSVRQIGLNLLSNAVRYTQAGGQVIVSTSYEANGAVVMRVRDTGIGMSAAEIDQALKPFKQLNTLRRPRGDGTGLGLPLTRAMVEANRARFSISSTPGEGTLVEITFPPTRVLAD